MGNTYEESGVDISAGEEAVDRIKEKVRSTFRPEVVGDIGGFVHSDITKAPSAYSSLSSPRSSTTP